MASSSENSVSEEGNKRNSNDRDASSASFQYLLRTNDPPPEFEAHRLRTTLLSDAQKDLDELKEKHARLLASAAEVQEERDALEKFIDNHKVILSPVRRVPPEILSEIFLNLRQAWYDVFDVTAGPWLLGRVCSRWRSAALSYPRIWSNISFSRYGDRPIPRFPIPLLEMALERSGQQKLSLYIKYSLSPEVQGTLLDTLICHSDRWGQVDFTIPTSFLPRLARVGGRLSSLSTLKLAIHVQNRVLFESPTVIDAFQDAPKLRVVELGAFNRPGEAFRLPWSQLTQISLEYVSMDAMTAILRLAPNLTMLMMSSPSLQAPDMSDTIPVVHTSLVRLVICGGGTIPSNIVLPALEDLDLAVDSEMMTQGTRWSSQSLSAMTELLHRSKCSLRELGLSCVEMGGSLIGLLGAASTVVELKIEFANFTEEDDRSLGTLIRRFDGEPCLLYSPYYHDDDEPPLLPHLEVLEIDVWSYYVELAVEFVDSDFSRFMAGRREVVEGSPVAIMRRVRISAHDDAQFLDLDLVIEEIQDLKKDGLDISISIDDKIFI